MSNRTVPATAEGMPRNSMAGLVARHRRFRATYAIADFGNDKVAGEKAFMATADTEAYKRLTEAPPEVANATDLVAALSFIAEDEAYVCAAHKRFLERALAFLTPWGTPTTPTQPDAELLHLGAALNAAWAAQDAAEAARSETFDEAYAAASAIVNLIEAVPATTLAGLRVKAWAVSWCHSGEPISAESFGGCATADTRLVAAIMRDLLATS